MALAKCRFVVQAVPADFFKLATERDPEYAEAWAGWGTALYNRGGAMVNSKFTDRSGSEALWRKAIAIDPDPHEDRLYKADVAPDCPDTIPISKVLRLTHLTAGQNVREDRLYRVIFIRDNKLRILIGVSLNGMITFDIRERVDTRTEASTPVNATERIDVRELEDFIAKVNRVPLQVGF